MSNLASQPGGDAEAKTPSPGEMLWNPDQTLQRLGGDENLLHEIIEIFLEDAPRHLAALREAITQQDAETLERTAHSLQGELGYLSASELSHGARALEEKGRTADFKAAGNLLPAFEAALSHLLSSIAVAAKIASEQRLCAGSSAVSPAVIP
jgi:two-component system sensor histidine kinase/response regulator